MYYAFITLWLFSYYFILFYVIHANCVLCVVPWVGGVDVYTMCAVHRLSALVSWERLCVSISVLHGLGLGPQPTGRAGSGFYNSLRAGPGAGLKLAGPGRARAGK